MTRHKRLLVLGGAAVALAVAAVLLSPACYWRALGWARGEAFYRGRPTSYWAWRIGKDMDVVLNVSSPPGSWWAELHERLNLYRMPRVKDLPFKERDPAAVPVIIELIKRNDFDVNLYLNFILCEPAPAWPEAVSALHDLMDDPDPEVRTAAANALKELDARAARAAGFE